MKRRVKLPARWERQAFDAERDWGFAGDYVVAMWRMLQADAPADYVVGTGKTHSVRQLCQIAFDHVGLDWDGHVRVDAGRFRPAEVDHLRADAARARAELGWSPGMEFEELVRMMVDADLARLRDPSPVGGGERA